MSLTTFSIIVAIDSNNGIAKNGQIPWILKEDMSFFRNKTTGNKKNAVIMGRKTYESIDEKYRPLEGRKNVIISRTWKQENFSDILIYPSIGEALAGLGSTTLYEEVFIAGGEEIYKEAIRDYLYLCKKIYVSKLKLDYKCDQFFPFDSIKSFPLSEEPVKKRDFTIYTYTPGIIHSEYSYLNLLKEISETGELKPDRTGTGVKYLFGKTLEFDIRDRLPIITTKKVFYDSIIKELLFFISGKTDTEILEKQKVNIWKGNTTSEFLKKNGLKWREKDMGPGYGFQLRYYGAEYKGCDTDYTDQGIDQLQNLIKGIRDDPYSRRHVLCYWNVSQISEMALPPCHFAVVFSVSPSKYLNCHVTQRSGDCFLGIPFNVTSYALLTYMIAHICNLKPGKLMFTIVDAHIYNNHGEQVKRQLTRTPRPFPKLSFRNATQLQEINDFNFDSFIIEGYTSWQPLLADMAV